jgi:hypothetical protein
MQLFVDLKNVWNKCSSKSTVFVCSLPNQVMRSDDGHCTRVSSRSASMAAVGSVASSWSAVSWLADLAASWSATLAASWSAALVASWSAALAASSWSAAPAASSSWSAAPVASSLSWSHDVGTGFDAKLEAARV